MGALAEVEKNRIECIRGNDVMIWEPPVAGWRNRYVIGGDIGGGLSDGDKDCAFVKDRVLNRYVACIHGSFGPERMGRLLRLLGLYYDRCMIGHENNNHGIGVTMALREADYPNIYRNSEGDHVLDYGFQTNQKTRTIGLELLKRRFEDISNSLDIPYLHWYREALAFQCAVGSSKPEGMGEHDDTIMASMITESVCATLPKPELIEHRRVFAPNQIGSTVAMGLKKNTSKALTNW
jgi:hypothetical protein